MLIFIMWKAEIRIVINIWLTVQSCLNVLSFYIVDPSDASIDM